MPRFLWTLKVERRTLNVFFATADTLLRRISYGGADIPVRRAALAAYLPLKFPSQIVDGQ